jgi:SPP1 gp7 family putative phage head morphogenesis protein
MTWKVSADPVDFVEAIAWFRKRIALTKAEWRALDGRAKATAFTVAGVAQLDLINHVWRALDKAVTSGTSLEDFKRDVGNSLRAAWGGHVKDPAWRLETIFRTNVQSAYSAGRYRQAKHPDVIADRPFWMFDAILDGRETPICKICDGVTLPADDPWWNTHVPPLHYSCRSSVIALHDAKPTKKPPSDVPPDGFGLTPADAEWAPDLAKYPKPLADAFVAKQKAAPPPRPASKPTAGEHFESLQSQGIPNSDVKAILQSVSDQETLDFLKRAPLKRLNIQDLLFYKGDKVDGLYHYGVGNIDLEASPKIFGMPWVPRQSWTVSEAEPSRLRTAAANLRHELGHHIHSHDPTPKLNRLVFDAFQRAQGAGVFLTKYAKTDRNEYFAECYCAYYLRRADLKKHDPNGFAMVEDALRERGILP